MAPKIMIVEDEPDIRLYLMAVLEDNGFIVCIPSDDASVCSMAQQERPDLILLDILMPRRSGVSIYRELRSNPNLSGTKIALFSGMDLEPNMETGGFHRLLGDDTISPPDGFIPKGIRVGSLLDAVRTLLEAPTR